MQGRLQPSQPPLTLAHCYVGSLLFPGGTFLVFAPITIILRACPPPHLHKRFPFTLTPACSSNSSKLSTTSTSADNTPWSPLLSVVLDPYPDPMTLMFRVTVVAPREMEGEVKVAVSTSRVHVTRPCTLSLRSIVKVKDYTMYLLPGIFCSLSL